MHLMAVLLCWVVLGLAQSTFGPVRVDDGRGEIHFYPGIYLLEDGNPYVIWANQAEDFVGAYGQEVALDGSLIGENDVYQQVNLGSAQCPPALTLTRFDGGNHAQLIMHN